MNDKPPQITYFHDQRTPNLSGLISTIVAATGICLTLSGALIVQFASEKIGNMFAFLMVVGFVLSIIGTIVGIASCLACAGHLESIRGVNLSLAAVVLGALGIVAPIVAMVFF